MKKLFGDICHMDKFNNFMTSVNSADVERAALFFIMSGSDWLYDRKDMIYDFEKNCLKLDFDENGDLLDNLYLSSSELSLLKLAIQLYNGNGATSVNEIFNTLDSDNANLALNAIKIRYKIID